MFPLKREMLRCETHRQDLHVLGDVVLPGKAEDVRKVKGKVNDATAGCCQVGLVEENTEEEALHDGSRGESEQKKEEDEAVAVVQYPSSLEARDREKQVFQLQFMESE